MTPADHNGAMDSEVVSVADATLRADYLALTGEVGVVELSRDAVRVVGPDAFTFLQGQLSQNVDIAVDTSTPALLLSPQGKMVAFVRVLRTGDEEFVLDVDGGWAGPVRERLLRFKLRVKAEVEEIEGWRALAVLGPGTAGLSVPDTAGGTAGPVRIPVDSPPMVGFELVGTAAEPPKGVRSCGLAAYEALRIEAGLPAMGSEIDESTIPAEAGIVDRSVSFTKGCYTGQELVARIDSRGGNVPRRLRGVVLAPGTTTGAGATLVVDGSEVGRLTSAAFSPGAGGVVGLAYVTRKVVPPTDAELAWDGGSVPARITELPIPGGLEVGP